MDTRFIECMTKTSTRANHLSKYRIMCLREVAVCIEEEFCEHVWTSMSL